MKIIRTAAFGLAWLFLFSATAPAQEVTAATSAATSPTPADLEQRLAALEAKAAAQPPIKAEVSSTGVRLSGPDGYEMRIKTLVQTDGNWYFNDETAPKANTLQLRRVRLLVDAKGPQNVSLRLQPDFGQGKITMLDSYIDLMPWAWLGLRAGKFKTPVNLERLLPDPALMFPELSLSSTLTPNRDVGVVLQGTIGKGLLTYAAGVFNGVVDGASGDLDYADDKDLVGRVFSEPFAATENPLLHGIGLGVGASAGNQRGTFFQKTGFAPTQNLASLKSVGGTTFFAFSSGSSYAGTVVADGPNRRVAPQAWYWAGPFGLVAEYVQAEHQVKQAGKSADIRFDAWSATAGLVLTGEHASQNGVVPAHPVGEGFGAWQIVGQAGSLIVDPEAFPRYANPAKSARAARAVGVALNWYASTNLRTSVAYEQTRFEEASDAVPALPTEKFLMARLQLGFL